MINSFKSYLVEEEKSIYFTFGRMNPPTIGHEKLISTLAEKSGRNPYRVYLSQSQDSKKNPLHFAEKIKYARKMFPRHARQIMANKKVRNVFDVASKLYSEGYRSVTLVVGSDRLNEFKILLSKYNGKKGRHGFYNFENIRVVSAGARDPDAEGATGMSASKMRQAVTEKNFTKFSQGLPRNMSNAEAKKLYNSVRTGMGLKEQKVFKNSIQLEKISDVREAYVNGRIFNIGETVIIKGTKEFATIVNQGSNYVIVETKDGISRKWLHSIQPYNRDWNPLDSEIYESDERPKKTRQDPDVKDAKGTQPAPYFAGLKKSTKKSRLSHFKKHAKMDDDNPAAYKDAPGDKQARKKGMRPSKHTLKYRRMYGEDMERIKRIDDANKRRDEREARKDKQDSLRKIRIKANTERQKVMKSGQKGGMG